MDEDEGEDEHQQEGEGEGMRDTRATRTPGTRAWGNEAHSGEDKDDLHDEDADPPRPRPHAPPTGFPESGPQHEPPQRRHPQAFTADGTQELAAGPAQKSSPPRPQAVAPPRGAEEEAPPPAWRRDALGGRLDGLAASLRSFMGEHSRAMDDLRARVDAVQAATQASQDEHCQDMAKLRAEMEAGGRRMRLAPDLGVGSVDDAGRELAEVASRTRGPARPPKSRGVTHLTARLTRTWAPFLFCGRCAVRKFTALHALH